MLTSLFVEREDVLELGLRESLLGHSHVWALGSSVELGSESLLQWVPPWRRWCRRRRARRAGGRAAARCARAAGEYTRPRSAPGRSCDGGSRTATERRRQISDECRERCCICTASRVSPDRMFSWHDGADEMMTQRHQHVKLENNHVRLGQSQTDRVTTKNKWRSKPHKNSHKQKCDVVLWSWNNYGLSITGELRSWHVHMQKVKVNSWSVGQTWEQTDGMTRPIAIRLQSRCNTIAIQTCDQKSTWVILIRYEMLF